jgi:release factor glutamine methyltransferase
MTESDRGARATELPPATCGETLRRLTERLAAAGVASARLDARLLVAHALGISPTAVFSHPERPLSRDDAAAVAAAAARRLRREPVSRIIGRREFWSLSFKITPDTLDPRPDSETIVEAVLERLSDRLAPLTLLDLGTGTGCLLLALLSELPRATGIGVDINPGALAAARENARALGFDGRASFVASDWGREIDGSFDVIVANPPYIPEQEIAGLDPEVAEFDPPLALAGGPDGLACYRAMTSSLVRLLARQGFAVLEIGQGQSQAVEAILQGSGLTMRQVCRDLAGCQRGIVCCRG